MANEDFGSAIKAARIKFLKNNAILNKQGGGEGLRPHAKS